MVLTCLSGGDWMLYLIYLWGLSYEHSTCFSWCRPEGTSMAPVFCCNGYQQRTEYFSFSMLCLKHPVGGALNQSCKCLLVHYANVFHSLIRMVWEALYTFFFTRRLSLLGLGTGSVPGCWLKVHDVMSVFALALFIGRISSAVEASSFAGFSIDLK